MADAKQLDIILKIAADRQAANQAAQVVDNLDQDLAAVGKTTDSVSQRLARISRDAKIDRIGESFGKMAVKIRDTDKAAAALQKRLEGIGATDDEIQRATGAFAGAANVGGGGRQRLAAGLGQFALQVRNQAAIQIPGTGISSDAVAKMVALFANLPPIAGALIPVLGSMAAGFVFLESSMQGAKASLNDAVAANKAYYDLISKGEGLEAGKKRLEELQRIQDAQQKELADIDRATSGAFAGLADDYKRRTGTDFGARIVYGLGQISTADDELAKRHDELTKSIAENKTEVEGITRAINDGTLASNDYRKALEEEAKIKRDAAIAGANDEYNRQLKLQQDSLLNTSQLFSKVTAAIQEQNAAQAALNQLQADKARGVIGEDIDKQITEFQLKVARSGADITRYYDLIAQRKPIEDAIQNEKDLAAARKEVDKINDDVQKATEKRASDLDAIAQKIRDSLADLKSQFDNANLEAEIERQQKLADLAGETSDKQREEETKLAEDRVKIQEDYQKRVKEIERDFSRSSAEAIQDRDAVALDAAKQKRADELDDAKQDRDDKLKERQREYNAEMRQLQKSNADKIAEINREFQREAEQRARKYAYDQQQLQINGDRDRAQRQAAYEKQLADLRTNLQQHTSLWQQAGQAIVSYAQQVVGTINNLIRGGNSAVVSGAASNTNPADVLGGIFGYGAGRSNGGSTGLGVRSPKPPANASVSLAVNGMGLNSKQVVKKATQVLNDYFDAYDRAN